MLLLAPLFNLSYLTPHGPTTPPPPFAASVGEAYMSPDIFTVQDKTTFTYHYVVGPGGMAPGDSILIEDTLFHGVAFSQWGRIVTDPAECTPYDGTTEDPSRGLVTLAQPSGATLSLTRNVGSDGGGGSEYAYSEVVVEAGSLVEGDEIVLTYGDTSSNADCGLEFPDRAFEHLIWRAYEYLPSQGSSTYVELSESPNYSVQPFSTVSRLFVEVPSRALTGQAMEVKVVPLDVLGNPVKSWTGTVQLDAAYGGAQHTFSADDDGHYEFGVIFSDADEVHRVEVTGTGGLTGRSNPVQVFDSASPPDVFLYWGDIHVHFGSHYWDGDQWVDENVSYARDIMGLDIATESLKADPVSIDSAALWELLQENCTSETVDGSFLSLLGTEWMGNLVGENNGHHNFYFDSCDVPFPSHYDATEYPDGVDGFGSGQGPYEWMDQLSAQSIQSVVIPHATRFTGFNWDETARNDTYRTTAEVYSEWGFSMEPPSAIGSIPDGIRKGNRMGFIAASDNHVGWMGNPFSYKTVRSGLAGFWAPSLDRASVFSSLAGRYTYATTGSRILLEFFADDGATIRPGLEYVADAPTFRWTIHGTAPISTIKLESVGIWEDATPSTMAQWTPNTEDVTGEYSFTNWDGSTVAVWLSVTQAVSEYEDQVEQAWSSPIWLTRDCDREGVEDPAERCLTGSEPNGSERESTPIVESQPDPESTPLSDSEPIAQDTGKHPGSRCGCNTPAPTGGLLLGILALWRRRITPR